MSSVSPDLSAGRPRPRRSTPGRHPPAIQRTNAALVPPSSLRPPRARSQDVEENLKPIVNALFSELTLLGFVGLFMFVVTKLQLFHGMSMRLFHEGDALSELFEVCRPRERTA